SNTPLYRNKIQLYCNQVFVTDQVENIVPEFLTLLHGVIDSPDIPLNVSRSYLQSDANVKKISTYITKKVSDRLASIAKTDKEGFEAKWDDLKLFIHYGMLSQNDFYDKASTYALLKDVDGKYFNYADYKEQVKGNQTDKDDTMVVLYATDAEAQYTAISAAKQKGYNVLLLDGQLDSPLVGLLEQKWEKARFVRVDSDTIERLIPQNNAEVEEVSEDDATMLSCAFQSVLPKISGAEFHVEVANMPADAMPVCITQSEYMRRMKDMSKLQEGMAFYGEMPDMYNLVLNANHPLVKDMLEGIKRDTAGTVEPLMAELRGMRARQAALTNLQNSKSDDAEAKEAAEESKKVYQEISDLEQKRDEALATYASKQEKMSQLVDLALLSQGLLKGESLSQFINRSLDLLG
ncbi:MAG: molecular chaperone HtpG, partial [Bacteroidaceae bacterium]|nr:molecular chaperone HtpG [Bacteroidaceae bacterium]